MQRSNVGNSGTGVGGGGVHQACASCKHQRKKCNEDCVLAPYFPADRNREFQAVHKVFGVSNVMKLVRSVNEEDRKSVADSLVWEALCRQNDPILGSLGEYRRVQEELRFFKSTTQAQAQAQTQTQTQAQTQIQAQAQAHQNQNQLVQNGMIAWNVPNGVMNTKSSNGSNIGGGGGGGELLSNNSMALNYNHENGNGNRIDIVDSIPSYNTGPLRYNVVLSEKMMKHEKENVGTRLVPFLHYHHHQQPQQHHVVGGFNQQQLYIPGQFGPINGKTMDGWGDEPN